jgi:hypothetical protein
MNNDDLIGRTTIYKGQSVKIIRRLCLPVVDRGKEGPEIPGWVQIEFLEGDNAETRIPIKLTNLGEG